MSERWRLAGYGLGVGILVLITLRLMIAYSSGEDWVYGIFPPLDKFR